MLESRSKAMIEMIRDQTYKQFSPCNEGESAASFCHQVAALSLNVFCNFYFVKNHKIAKSSATTKVREKSSTDLESLEY
jgi:hypothetical protein